MLQSWDEIKDRYKNGKLIIGNTFSCYLNEPMDYNHPKEIFQNALDDKNALYFLHDKPFFYLFTKKFLKEQVKTTKKFLRIFFQDFSLEEMFRSLYDTKVMVRLLYKHSQSLQKIDVTPPKDFLTMQYEILKEMYSFVLQKIHTNFHSIEANYPYYLDFLKHFRYIFSISYDLSLQWCIIKDVDWFQDGFGKQSKTSKKVFFSPDNFAKRDTNTHVFYLHGNFSLQKDEVQNITKIAPKGDNLVHRICEYIETDRFPVIITEGDKNYKKKAVQSEKVYLNRIYEEYLPQELDTEKGYSNSLVIYGPIMESEEYILEKVLENPLLGTIAISVDNEDLETSQKTEKQIRKILKQPQYKSKDINIDYFESYTVEKPM